MQTKSTIEEIRQRFDREVERFSNLETGQSATMDAPLVLDLITRSAALANPDAVHVLDVGCGAGNYSIKLSERLPHVAIDLLDVSGAMLDRAAERLGTAGIREITRFQGDVREVALSAEKYDIILASAVLHHLRTEGEWVEVFAKLRRSLRAGGSLWVSDLVDHTIPAVGEVMWARYGDYLTAMKDEEYRDLVYSYIAKEDSPRSVVEQIEWLRRVGFSRVEILHKNACFAAYGAIK